MGDMRGKELKHINHLFESTGDFESPAISAADLLSFAVARQI